MFDERLRGLKDRALNPLSRMFNAVSPSVLTMFSLVCCVGAGLCSWRHYRWVSVALWLFGRLLDGLDGAVARRFDRQSELGGYLDLLADTVGYAAVPLGVAAGVHHINTWMWCAAMIAAFYVNTMSWTLLSALQERQKVSALTTFHMPTGFIEGAETIVLFTLMLAIPSRANLLFGLMAGGVLISIVQRLVWAVRNV